MSASLTTTPIDSTFFAEKDNTLVTWLGMAGVLINTRGTILLIDPLISYDGEKDRMMSESGYPLKIPYPIEAGQVPHADMVMYTHGDDDHFGQHTVLALANGTNCRFLAPPPVARMIAALGIPQERIRIARDFETLSIGPAEVDITPALHDWQEVNPWQRGDCCGYLVKTPDGVIWHPGDTRLIDELLEVKGVDILFYDVASVDSHLGAAGSAKLAASCGAKAMIAYHYGTFDMPPGTFANFDPDDALPYVRDLPAPFLKLNPGELFCLPER